MEKAIDIKRRAQRCVQNNDLDGALKEYEKLIAVQDSDPYNFVLLADLLFKKGNQSEAASRYLTAIEAYEKTTLYKNAIAVGKKMMRLSLSPSLVLGKLATLHALDGLGTEAALYYQQYAEILIREGRGTEAADSLRKGFEASPENVKLLDRLADVLLMEGDAEAAARTFSEAAVHYESAGQLKDAERCRARASTFSSGAAAPTAASPSAGTPVAPAGLELERSHFTSVSETPEPPALELEPTASAPPPATPVSADITHSMEIGPETNGEAPAGPPALEPMIETAPPTIAPAAGRASVGPPPLSSLPPAAPQPVANAAPTSPPPAPSAPTPVPPAPAGGHEAPGLRFEAPADVPAATPMAAEPPRRAAPPPAAHPDSAPQESPAGMAERLLREARELFRKGERETASQTLVRAARLYDDAGQFDSAATIYRNLGRSTQATTEVMTLWLRNCEARNDRREAAQVACELGDRSLNDGDQNSARDWFRRATTLDATNETAKRRLQRLDDPRGPGVLTQSPENGEGRVEIAVGRSEAVTFDLGSLVSEFQRGVETQISGDPQGHYDLGMAYREMGLLEQAIEAFRAAGRDSAFAQRCAEMIGRSMLDQGRFEEAAQEFIVALELPGLSPEGTNDLRFQLGLAYEAAGRSGEALAEFERVYAESPSYPDVASKIRALRSG